ncbi:hypothetical protein E1267_38990 [Nonomuraea longispora]|uniref:Uncharacterized protein n=1 Tax=Nonomuraea longispora TaxID=1848320 RepID=A0A4R4MQ29_9ACTN|nr:hypothetical protein [Nonomuraea longispora]TDB98160.1 hypothetical protein E1267_38990 [Nonomuraea longispora]
MPSSATPGRPGASGPSKRPGSEGDDTSDTFGQTLILPERPASSAESEAKPKGPLPTGAPSQPGAQGATSSPERASNGAGDTGTPKGAPPAARPQPSGTPRKSAGKPQQGQGDQGQGKARPGVQPSGGGSAKTPAGTSTSEGAEGRTRDASEGGDGDTVKVIVGTRRYHSTDCPLIRGAGDSGVETMAVAAAEAAGLTSCSVCQHDRESVS